jgi:peptidoglycan/LPS O-acetylase OafA/YrhL
MRDRSHRVVLEGVRGLVVSCIVLFHALRLVLARHGGNWGDVSPIWWWAGTFRFGVDAFFVMAGFLVVRSWRTCQARATSWWGAARDFAGRRAWRILPPYLATLVVLVPLVNPDLLQPDRWRDLLRLLTVQGYLDVHLPASVNVPSWSLTTEVHFYLVTPLLAWFVAKVGGWKAWLVAAATSVWWVETTFRGDLAAALLPGRIDDFVLGAAVGGLLSRVDAGQPSRWVRALTSRGALPLLTAGLVAVGIGHGGTYQHHVDGPLVALVHPAGALLLAGLLVRLVAGAPVRRLEHPALVWLGSISFSLYLWHYPILSEGLQRTGALRAPLPVVLLATGTLVGLGVLVSLAAHRLVEIPSVRRRSAARRRAPEAPTPSPALPVVQPELGLQDLQEVAGPEGDQAGAAGRRRAHDRVALPQLPQVPAVDAQRRRAVALDG